RIGPTLLPRQPRPGRTLHPRLILVAPVADSDVGRGMDAPLDRVAARVQPVRPVALPLVAGDRRLDREQQLVIAARRVDPVADGDEAHTRPLERLPDLGRRQAILPREPVLPGDDDPGRLPLLTRLDRLPQLALPPR